MKSDINWGIGWLPDWPKWEIGEVATMDKGEHTERK